MGQLITGVGDRQIYSDRVTFSVPQKPGFIDSVTLNSVPIDASTTNLVERMDYYELLAKRSDRAALTTVTQLVRFIVVSSRRGDPENGLIEWTPFPPTPSSAEELVGGKLTLVLPQSYPTGLEIPVVAWIDDGPGNARRVNGSLNGTNFPNNPLQLRRGVGHTFLPAAPAGHTAIYDAQIGPLTQVRSITIDQTNFWQTTTGAISLSTTWSNNSRIHVVSHLTVPAGMTLTIDAGTVVWLDPGVNITNNGRILVNGTAERPVVFTPAAHVAPEQHGGAWGGLIMRGNSAELIATGAILTGAGAAANFSFAPGSSHRSEQALLLVQSGAKAYLTNCFLINNAGQVGNGYNAEIIFDHCLLQRAITGGEYEGGSVTVNNSAIIEFPTIDGEVNARIADADYDAIYFTTGTHLLKDSLIGFSKDDAIDSGSGGAGTVRVSHCWIESALHEALAWSGGGRQTWSSDSVLMNCGQGIECGWSTGANSPLCHGERLLSTANAIGARYGDNYTGTTGLGLKTGILTLTNSFVIHNYRDVFGRCWDDTWNYRDAQMDIRSNFLTVANSHHLTNEMWQPTRDAAKLNAFMGTPIQAKVGIGFANWIPLSTARLSDGIPVRLSTFTSHPVSIAYALEGQNSLLRAGRLEFTPGESIQRILAPPGFATNELLRVILSEPSGAEITTADQQIIGSDSDVADSTIIPLNSDWKYFDDGSDQATGWRSESFDDSDWRQGAGQFGFGDNDETTHLSRLGTNGATNITFYFRKKFIVEDPSKWQALIVHLLRDDAGVVYINGREIFRSPNLPSSPALVDYTTRATSTGENTVDIASAPVNVLQAGENSIAVEIHQESTTSSDVSFDLELVAVPQAQVRLNVATFRGENVLYWSDPAFHLETTEALGSSAYWQPLSAARALSIPANSSRRFYRLRR